MNTDSGRRGKGISLHMVNGKDSIKNTIFTATMLAPAGQSAARDSAMPARQPPRPRAAAPITMPRKPVDRRRAVTAGKMMSPEMRSVPAMRIPATTVRAVRLETRNW